MQKKACAQGEGSAMVAVVEFHFQRAGDPDPICHEGDALAQRGASTFDVLLHGNVVASVDNVVMHWRQMTYEQVWNTIDADAREHLGITGDEFMNHYFDQSTDFYGKPVYYSLTHLADLIADQYREAADQEPERDSSEPHRAEAKLPIS